MPKYLYNGVELPALPEWDKEAYPYAFLYSIIGAAYVLVVSDALPYCVDSLVYVGNTMASGCGTEIIFTPTTEDSFAGRTHYGSVFWTNTDILNSDGTLYLAASDPIPVGTAPALDPLSLFMGWKAGNWVARQRGKA